MSQAAIPKVNVDSAHVSVCIGVVAVVQSELTNLWLSDKGRKKIKKKTEILTAEL